MVSIIIPAYNAACTIVQTIESVLNQSYNDYEIIVVDDGSTDGTSKRLIPYTDRIVYLYQSNQGRSTARNNGIRKARGRYIAFLDADDFWLPNRLSRQVPILEENPEILLIYSKAKVVDGYGNDRLVCGHTYEIGRGINKPEHIYEQLIVGNLIPMATVILRTSILDQAGLFDEKLSYPEDWDLWIRISRFGKIYFIPETLACYRVEHDDRSARFISSTDVINQQLALISKSFDSQANKSLDRVCMARAWVFARASIAAAQLNDLHSEYMYWLETLREYPSFLNGSEVYEMVQKAVFTAHLIENSQGYEGASRFINRFASVLPISKRKRKKIKRVLLSQYFQSIVFQAYSKKDYATVRKYILPGLLNSPTWITNRGFWKIGLIAGINLF